MTERRIGVHIQAPDAAAAVEQVVQAESLGIPAAWMATGGAGPDGLTLLAASAVRTERILLGTSITPTWPRHPIAIAQQVIALEALAPGRFRLGIGPSHEPMMTSMFGVRWRTPLAELREYLVVLRALLHDGEVEFEGEHVTARAKLSRPVATPIMASALRKRSFELCGELADGAISWNCPAAYLREEALPALRRGAEAAGRAPPPLVAHVPIAVEENIEVVREATRRQIGGYAQIPFYRAMFEAAGFPRVSEGVTDDLVDALVIHGDEEQVAHGLVELLESGMGEVLAMPLLGDDRAASIERGFAAVALATA